MNWKKIIISGLGAGLVMLVLMLLLMPVWNMVFPGLEAEYMNTEVYRAWDDPLMSYIFVHPFLMGLLMAFTYDLFKPFQNYKEAWKKGTRFGLVYWLIAIVPGMLITYASFIPAVVSGAMVLSWTLDALIRLFVGGVVLAYLYARK